MMLQEAVDILRKHNQWRRDDGMCIDMGDPKQIGIAIDTLCNAADALIESDRMYSEQIARNLANAKPGD